MNLRRWGGFALAVACSTFGLSGAALVGASNAYASALTVYYSKINSGYNVYSSTVPPATASTTLKVPMVKDCPKTGRGIGFGPLVEDSGGDGAEAFVEVGCVGGKATYSGGLDMFGTITTSATTVHPGNSLSLSATMNATSTSATFTDTSTGYSRTVTGASGTAAYAFIGSFPADNSAHKLLGVPHFATLTFTNAKVNGAGIGTYDTATGLYEFIRTTNGKAPPKGKVQVEPSALKTSSFSLAFEHK
jgi:hypothetical protein